MKIKFKPVKIRPIDFWCWTLFLLMMDYPYINGRTRFIIKGVIILAAFAIAACIFRKTHFLRDNWPIFPYAIFIVLSGYMNYKFSDMFIRSVLYAVMFISVYSLPNLMGRRFGFEDTIASMFRALRAIVCISGAVAVVTLGRGIDPSQSIGNYIIGNKFLFSYFCMLFLAMYCMMNLRNKNMYILALTVVLSGLCLLVKCATGTVGLVTICVLFIAAKPAYRFLRTFGAIAGGLALSSVLVIGFQSIISLGFIRSFITNVLNRSADMTGRFDIYEVLIRIFKQKMWFGHGYNNTAVFDIVGYGNPQNGIFDILINYGIYGLILFAVLCFFSVYKRRNDTDHVMFPIICFLYGMIVCATVEICLTNFFIVGLSLFRMYGGVGPGEAVVIGNNRRLRIRGR